MSDLIGSSFGQYQILREIGRGGMAVVYEAYQPSLTRRVAIKVLQAHLAADAAFVDRFLLEARAAARLEHPNIVAIYEVGEWSGYYFIAMRELTGESLHSLIQHNGRLSLDRTIAILSQVASALDYAHSHGVIHRDIKPANIIVGVDDHATLTDFGIAKLMEGRHLTQTGAMMGTPEYMSPDQAIGKPVGPSSDIYSLGIVFYQMLTGRVPFQADSTPVILYKHVYEQPGSVRTYAPGLPTGVDSVLARALAKDPEQRFRTAGEFVAAMQAVLTSGIYTPQSAFRKKTPPPLVRKRRRMPAWAVILGAAALTLLFLAIFMLLSMNNYDFRAVFGWVRSGRASPSPTATNTPLMVTPTPTSTTLPLAPQVLANQDVSVFTGAGREFAKAGQVKASQTKQLLAQTEDGSWLQICCVNGDPAWVPANLVQIQGNLAVIARVTATFTLTPTPTRTPTPKPSPATRTRTPTSEPATPTPTSTPTPTLTPTPSNTPRPLPPPSPPMRANLRLPTDGTLYNQRVLFEWSASRGLRANEGFEVRFWKPGQDPRTQGFSPTGVITVQSLYIDLGAADDNQDLPFDPGTYQWSVFLVQTRPYKLGQDLSPGRQFTYERH